MFENEFYKSLKKSNLTPPAVVFRYTWSILYFLMFTSAIIVLTTPESNIRTIAIYLFLFQLILNFVWSPVFFLYGRVKTAFAICVVLTILVGIMTYLYYLISQIAGILSIPYFLWLIFACFLNFEVIRLNKDV